MDGRRFRLRDTAPVHLNQTSSTKTVNSRPKERQEAERAKPDLLCNDLGKRPLIARSGQCDRGCGDLARGKAS
jgi:hypothetical protein